MSEPKRIQRKRTKGWRMPEGTVYVGRPSKWGNDYHAGSAYMSFTEDGRIVGVVIQDAAHAVEAFREDCIFDDIAELRGKDLACWCKLSDPCHADVLLEWANHEVWL